MKKEKDRLLKKGELLILLLIAAAMLLLLLLPKKSGAAVRVTVDGADYGTFPLSEDIRESISGYGGFCLTLVIEDGAAFVEESSCPDLICQNHAPISREGEQIVCLPARIVITALDGDESSEEEKEDTVDAVTR